MLEKLFGRSENSWELKKKEITKRVKDLTRHSFTEKKVVGILEAIQKIEKFEENTENTKILNSLQKELNETSLVANTLPEFMYALEAIGLDEHLVKKVVAHENAHGNKADELGAEHINYTIAFYKKENGQDAVLPMAFHQTPGKNEGWSKEKWKATEIQISLAPDSFGEASSSGDKDRVEKLKNM